MVCNPHFYFYDLIFHLYASYIGLIDVKEIKSYCDQVGVPISDAKAQNVVEKFVFQSIFSFYLLYSFSDHPDQQCVFLLFLFL